MTKDSSSRDSQKAQRKHLSMMAVSAVLCLCLSSCNAAPTDRTSQPSATTGAPNLKSNEIALTAKKNVWVSVAPKDGGKDVFAGLLSEGETKTFDASKGLKIRAAKGEDVSVTWQGKTEPFSQESKTAERTYEAEGEAK